MILLIGMLFIKEEETRGTFVSTLHTTSSQSGKRRNQPFSLLLGEGVSLERPIQPKRTTPSCMNPTGNAKRE